MAGYRRIPNDLALRERSRRPWIFELLFDLDLDDREGRVSSERTYAEHHGVNRSVIRRLMAQRRSELEQATTKRPPSDQQTTKAPSKSNGLAVKSDRGATTKRPASDTPIQETETGNREKRTLCPEPIPAEILTELRFRCSLRFPDEDASRRDGRIERAQEARILTGYLAKDWLRSLWGYVDQVDRGERERKQLPPPEALAVLKARHEKKLERRQSLRVVKP